MSYQPLMKLREFVMNKNSFYQFFNRDKSKGQSGQLPLNRFLAYFDIVKLRFTSLMLISLLTSVFFLPFLIFNFIANLYILMPQLELTNTLDIAFRVFSLRSIEYLVNIPLLILGFIGLGGTFNVVSKLVFQEPDIQVFKDFIIGVKKNFKESLVSGLIFSFFLFIYIFNLYFYPTIDDFPLWLSIVFIIILSICFIVFAALSLFTLSSAPIYRFEMRKTLTNHLLLSVILLPKNLLFLFISLFFMVGFILIPYILIQMLFFSCVLVFGFSHLALVYVLYSHSVFDRYINLYYEPTLIAKGLSKNKE